MIRIFATSATTGERFQISDLYWIEENGVQDWNGQGHDYKFTFEIYLEKPQKTPNWKPIDTAPKDGRRILIAYWGWTFWPFRLDLTNRKICFACSNVRLIGENPR